MCQQNGDGAKAGEKCIWFVQKLDNHRVIRDFEP
jgi:hypothetical protein